MTAHVKGSVFAHLKRLATDAQGEAAWARVLEALPAEDRERIDGRIVGTGWEPVGLWNAALEAYVSRSFEDSDLGARTVARYVADHDLNTLFKLLLKAASPGLLLGRAESLWSRYFDVGALTAREVGERSWHLSLDAPLGPEDGPGLLVCRGGVPGWLEQGLEMTGARSPTARHVACRYEGARTCEYDVHW